MEGQWDSEWGGTGSGGVLVTVCERGRLCPFVRGGGRMSLFEVVATHCCL